MHIQTAATIACGALSTIALLKLGADELLNPSNSAQLPQSSCESSQADRQVERQSLPRAVAAPEVLLDASVRAPNQFDPDASASMRSAVQSARSSSRSRFVSNEDSSDTRLVPAYAVRTAPPERIRERSAFADQARMQAATKALAARGILQGSPDEPITIAEFAAMARAAFRSDRLTYYDLLDLPIEHAPTNGDAAVLIYETLQRTEPSRSSL